MSKKQSSALYTNSNIIATENDCTIKRKNNDNCDRLQTKC